MKPVNRLIACVLLFIITAVLITIMRMQPGSAQKQIAIESKESNEQTSTVDQESHHNANDRRTKEGTAIQVSTNSTTPVRLSDEEWINLSEAYLKRGFTRARPYSITSTNYTWASALSALGFAAESARADEFNNRADLAAYLWYSNGVFYEIAADSSCTDWVPLGKYSRMPASNSAVNVTIWHSNRPPP